MPLARPRLLMLLVLVAALPDTILAATDPCPSSFIDFLGSPSSSSLAARDSTLLHCYLGGYNNCGIGGPVHSQRGAYDLVAGTILSNSDSWAYFTGALTSVGASDVYRIEGPTSGPLTFAVEVHVQSTVRGPAPNAAEELFASSLARLRLVEGASSAEFLSEGETFHGGPGYNLVRDTTLTLPLSHLVGEPFALTLTAEAGAQTRAFGEIRGALRFTGLPVGYTVVSCQGFAGGPTPAAHRSWGDLKVRYR